MHRLFVAARPPDSIRRLLRDRMIGVPGARWQSDDQLHLTLRFIGEVDGTMAADILDALGRVASPSIDAHLTGAGLFDRRGRVDSLWVGAAPPAPLADLHRKIDRALVTAGLEPERRTFLPHVTVARFSRGGGDPDSFLAANAGFRSPPFRVDSFTLYESHLGREGAHYRPIETLKIGR